MTTGGSDGGSAYSCAVITKDMFYSVADVARTNQDWVGDFGVIITNFDPSTLVADPVALADALSQIVGVSMSVG